MRISESGLAYGRGYVYNLKYHIVWCTKYRKKILVDDIEAALKNEIRNTCNELGVNIITFECMSDHIHLLLDCSPQVFIPTIIKILKGNAARRLFIQYPELKKQLYDGHLWNPSYFVATVSENSQQQIEEYINKQKEK